MKFISTSLVFALTMILSAVTSSGAEPVPIIFDTDMDSDCDDAGALAMLHALARQGEARILATPISARHAWSGPCVDAINTYFGMPDLPIGVPAETPNQQGSKYARKVAGEFPHDFPAKDPQPDAIGVYRRVLAEQKDGSVVIVTVGDVTNIRDLLKSEADDFSPLSGIDLVKQKVSHWVCMGGRYPRQPDPAKYGNFKMDPEATVEAVKQWPLPVIFTGGGTFARKFPAGKRLRELPSDNPVRRVYEEYFGGVAKDRHCADQIAVMVAVRGPGAPWKEIKKGYNHIFDNGTHEWRDSPNNPLHSYVSNLADDADAQQVTDLMESLMLVQPK